MNIDNFLSPSVPVDLSNCDFEPIHIPGLIQPHGILLALQRPSFKIIQVSNNTDEILGISPQSILGKTLDIFFDSQQIKLIKNQLAEDSETINPINLSIQVRSGKVVFDGIIHRSDGLIILELEPYVDEDNSNFLSFYHLVQPPIAKIQQTSNLRSLCQVIVQSVRNLTEFDRVMIYKFDESGVGKVIAEDKLEDLVSFLGLHYPASDIPKQARKLYTLNPLRFISDVNYQPVELIPVDNPLANQPLDLSFSVLRSVSPIHIEYLKNMGVNASMSISLIKDNKLWGLIACHHQSPKYISYKIRTACELLGKVMALELSSKEENHDLDNQIKLKSILSEFIEAISQNDNWIEVLLLKRAKLLELVDARGAAIYDDSNLTIVGKTPLLEDIKNLANWLGSNFFNHQHNYFYYSDCLPLAYPEAEKFKDVGSGLLVVSIPNKPNHYILWFRPEVIQVVNWGGNPNKPVEVGEDSSLRISPRKSFALWQETVRLKSRPWNKYELEIARELRNAIVGIVVRKVEKVAQINQQLTLALSAAKMVIWDWDVNSDRITWTSGYSQLLGLAVGTKVETYAAFIACIYPSDRASVNQALNKARLEQSDYYQELRVVWADGSIHWIEVKGKFIYNDANQAVRVLGTAIEISDRKAREEQLRLLESVVVNTNDAILITEAEPIDLPGPRIVYANPAFTQMTGYTLEEVLGQTPRILQGKKTDRVNLDKIKTALRKWSPVRVDLVNYTKDGSEFWVELSIVPVANEAGWYTHWIAVQRDITERKQAETALQELNEELEIRVQQRTFELQQSQIILQQQVERERLITRITQQIRQSLDLREILNTAVREVQKLLASDRVVIHRFFQNRTGSIIAEAVKGEWIKIVNRSYPKEIFPEKLQKQYLDGGIYSICDRSQEKIPPCMVELLAETQARAALVVSIIQQNSLWGLLVVHQCSNPREWQAWEIDLLKQLATQMAIAIKQSELYQQLEEELRERQRVESALRQSESLFRSLSESSPVGIFRTDTRGRNIYTNPRYQAICGMDYESALGDGWREFVHPEDLEVILPQWTASAVANQEFSSEVRYVHQDGTVHFCRVNTVPIFSESGEAMGQVGTVEDITESRAIEKMKNEFISIVSHELRTPLTSIRGSLGLLAAGVFDDQPEIAQQMLEIASSDTERLVRLVNDILDLERLEANKVTLVKQQCDVASLMRKSIETVQALAVSNQITLSMSPVSLEIWADSDRIIQTLVNLLSNAIKFSDKGCAIALSAVDLTDRVLFKVEDRGRGIPADKLETIFGRFQQVDASDSRQKGGTGLGLAICRSIVQQHGGRIWAESVLGEGSTFYFTLPKPFEA